jgi:hypothetical protein
MLKGFTNARLACGCRLSFRDGVEGSPVTVVVEQKAPACTLPIHVSGLPLYDDPRPPADRRRVRRGVVGGYAASVQLRNSNAATPK